MGGGSPGRGGGWLGRGDGRITQIATKSAIRAHAIYETFALPSDTRLWENHANSEQQQQASKVSPFHNRLRWAADRSAGAADGRRIARQGRRITRWGRGFQPQGPLERSSWAADRSVGPSKCSAGARVSATRPVMMQVRSCYKAGCVTRPWKLSEVSATRPRIKKGQSQKLSK